MPGAPACTSTSTRFPAPSLHVVDGVGLGQRQPVPGQDVEVVVLQLEGHELALGRVQQPPPLHLARVHPDLRREDAVDRVEDLRPREERLGLGGVGDRRPSARSPAPARWTGAPSPAPWPPSPPAPRRSRPGRSASRPCRRGSAGRRRRACGGGTRRCRRDGPSGGGSRCGCARRGGARGTRCRRPAAGETCRPWVWRLVVVHSWGRVRSTGWPSGRDGRPLTRSTFSVSPPRISQVWPGTTRS